MFKGQAFFVGQFRKKYQKKTKSQAFSNLFFFLEWLTFPLQLGKM